VNRTELEKKTRDAFHTRLHQTGYVSLVDLLLEMGKLTRDDHEAWRFRRVPFLERVVRLNLSQLNVVRRQVQALAREHALQPSFTAYVSWGQGPRTQLRFTRSGNPQLEAAYATHFVASNSSRATTHPPIQSPPVTDRDAGFLGRPALANHREARAPVQLTRGASATTSACRRLPGNECTHRQRDDT
jgi:hypothetical protein